MEAIIKFINEMRKSEWVDQLPFSERMYNGIKVIQAAQSYYNILLPLYNEAVIELVKIPNEKLVVLEQLIDEVEESQKYFEFPSEELLSSLMRDYQSSHNKIKSLKEDYDYLMFVKGCMEIQKSLLESFKMKIITTTETKEIENRQGETVNLSINEKQVIKGVKGLANFLNVGLTKAQDILNSGILKKEGIAYRAGKVWNINSQKLSQLLENNPELLYKRRYQ